MRKKWSNQVWLGTMALLVVAGCVHTWKMPVKSDDPVASQVPVPTAYAISTQQKMQAVHHWGVLAEDVSNQVAMALDGNPYHEDLRIYVVPSGTTPFEKAFRELLITQIVQKGIKVSNTPGTHAHLSTDIQMVRHHSKKLYSPEGVYRTLRPGLYVRDMPALAGDHKKEVKYHVKDSEIYVDAGLYSHEYPRNEIMITSSLTYDNDYMVRTSSIYYIDDPEWWQYMHKVSGDAPRMPVVNYQLIAR